MASSIIKSPKYIQQGDVSFTSSTTLAYTGVSITIPARMCFGLLAQAAFGNGAPKQILLSNSATSVEEFRVLANTIDGAFVSFSGYSGDTDMTFYVWAKYANASSNKIRYRAWQA